MFQEMVDSYWLLYWTEYAYNRSGFPKYLENFQQGSVSERIGLEVSALAFTYYATLYNK